jgi:hypothetical protein
MQRDENDDAAQIVADLREVNSDDVAFRWEIHGDCRRPNSSPEWTPESHGGTVTAESAPDALLAIITGKGAGGLDHSISWDLIDPDRPFTITIQPADGIDGHAKR